MNVVSLVILLQQIEGAESTYQTGVFFTDWDISVYKWNCFSA